MNRCALCIPRPGATSRAIQRGYVDALRYLGWTVYVCDPQTKLGCKFLIEKYNISLIMTSSRYGMRQIPVKVVNDRSVMVTVDALPLNPTEMVIDGRYEFAHEDEPNIVGEISKVVVHTRLEPHLWSQYMCGWKDGGVDLLHLMSAGNIINAMPTSFQEITDVAMVANFTHRQSIMRLLIQPLFERIDLLGYSYQSFGDNLWSLAGLSCNGPLSYDPKKLAAVYASCKVCPNVHTEAQVSCQAYLNERSFMVPLCGGLQVSDNSLASKYLGEYCGIANSTTDFIHKVMELIENQDRHFDKIKDGVEHVANNHTYFNRLVALFEKAGQHEYAEEIANKGQRYATRHIWAIDALLNAEERGVVYDKENIRTA